jgi:hypothetical protein
MESEMTHWLVGETPDGGICVYAPNTASRGGSLGAIGGDIVAIVAAPELGRLIAAAPKMLWYLERVLKVALDIENSEHFEDLNLEDDMRLADIRLVVKQAAGE